MKIKNRSILLLIIAIFMLAGPIFSELNDYDTILNKAKEENEYLATFHDDLIRINSNYLYNDYFKNLSKITILVKGVIPTPIYEYIRHKDSYIRLNYLSVPRIASFDVAGFNLMVSDQKIKIGSETELLKYVKNFTKLFFGCRMILNTDELLNAITKSLKNNKEYFEEQYNQYADIDMSAKILETENSYSIKYYAVMDHIRRHPFYFSCDFSKKGDLLNFCLEDIYFSKIIPIDNLKL